MKYTLPAAMIGRNQYRLTAMIDTPITYQIKTPNTDIRYQIRTPRHTPDILLLGVVFGGGSTTAVEGKCMDIT